MLALFRPHLVLKWNYVCLISQPNIRDVVASTYKAEDIWQQRDTSEYAIWRYIGSKEGLYRKIPGTTVAADYDPTLRPWSVNPSYGIL